MATVGTNDVVRDAFQRVREAVHGAVAGLTTDLLAYRPDPGANSIAWLVWHLTRIQDDHVAGLADTDQVWTGQGWAERIALPFDAHETGYGQSSATVGQVRVSGELLLGYHDAVHRVTDGFVAGLTAADYATVVDRSWDPPVTMAVRLVSVISDCLQHAGQAGYVRGLLQRR